MRRKVEQLQQRLLHFEINERDHSEDNSSSSDEDENLFVDGHTNASTDMNFHLQRSSGHHFSRDYDVKVDIPEFEKKINVEELSDWLHTVDRGFEYKDVPENRNVKLVAIKLKRHASIWWEHLKKRRDDEGKSCIVTWEKMMKELK